MKRCLPFATLLLCSTSLAAPLYLACSVTGKSFDQKFAETVGIRIDGEMIDVVSEEFPMFGKVEVSDTHYRATKRFTSGKGVRYFFSIELDRVSGRFAAYETAAYPDRKVYNTTGSGPCRPVSESRFKAIQPGAAGSRQSMRVTIWPPE